MSHNTHTYTKTKLDKNTDTLVCAWCKRDGIGGKRKGICKQKQSYINLEQARERVVDY
jgi:hypothetical protein